MCTYTDAGSIQLWTIREGGQLPAVTDEGIDAALDRLLAQ